MPLPDKDSFDTYGGEKEDYSAPIRPSTDRSAAEINQALCSTAMMTRTAVRAWVVFTPSNPPTIVRHDATWGNSGLVSPTVQRTDTGVFLISWPETVTDELGEERNVNLGTMMATVEHTTPILFSLEKTSPNQVTVRTFLAGVASDSTGKINLWII